MYMLNVLSSLNSYCKIMMTNCSLKQLKETMHLLSATASQSQVYFLLGLGLTYEHLTMAGLLIWLNLNYWTTHTYIHQ